MILHQWCEEESLRKSRSTLAVTKEVNELRERETRHGGSTNYIRLDSDDEEIYFFHRQAAAKSNKGRMYLLS